MPGTQTYKQTHIMTASPIELITMLYDEAIDSLEKVEAAFKQDGPERYQQISNNILHAQDIITELSVSLDMEQGGQIAANLQMLYDFMISHLCSANSRKRMKPVREVKDMLTELGETWKKVSEQMTKQAAPMPDKGIDIEG